MKGIRQENCLCGKSLLRSEDNSIMFIDYRYNEVDEKRIVSVSKNGIIYRDEFGELKHVDFSLCESSKYIRKLKGYIGETYGTFSALECAVVLYTPDVPTIFLFGEENRMSALVTPKEQGWIQRRMDFINSIENYGWKIYRG